MIHAVSKVDVFKRMVTMDSAFVNEELSEPRLSATASITKTTITEQDKPWKYKTFTNNNCCNKQIKVLFLFFICLIRMIYVIVFRKRRYDTRDRTLVWIQFCSSVTLKVSCWTSSSHNCLPFYWQIKVHCSRWRPAVFDYSLSNFIAPMKAFWLNAANFWPTFFCEENWFLNLQKNYSLTHSLPIFASVMLQAKPYYLKSPKKYSNEKIETKKYHSVHFTCHAMPVEKMNVYARIR